MIKSSNVCVNMFTNISMNISSNMCMIMSTNVSMNISSNMCMNMSTNVSKNISTKMTSYILMRDVDEHPTSFTETSQKNAKLKELSNNISSRLTRGSR